MQGECCHNSLNLSSFLGLMASVAKKTNFVCFDFAKVTQVESKLEIFLLSNDC